MKREILSLAVASLVTVGTGQYAAAQATAQPAQQRQQAQQQDMEQQAEALKNQLRETFPQDAVEIPEREPTELRTETQRMVRQALSAGKLTDAMAQISRVNRNALGKVSPEAQQQLDREIEALEQAFEQKYGESLDLAKHELFEDVALVRAEVRDAEQIGHLPLRPIPAQGAQRDVAANDAAGAGQGQQAQAQQARYGATSNTFGIDNNSKIGLMGVPMSGQNQHVIVTAVEESRPAAEEMAGEWRLILPMNYTADQLAHNLSLHIQQMRNQQAQWPEDAQIARQRLAQRALLAFYNLQPGGSAQQQQAQPSPAPAPAQAQ